MGNRSQDVSTNLSEDKGQEMNNDADFSMLMVNFRSAKLSSPPVSIASEEKQRGVPECNEDIVTPLQNFHLRPPVHNKTASHRRRKRRRESNELNLSVAAGSIQRPMMWPARLKTTATISRALLHPARLSALPLLTKSANDRISFCSIEKAVNKKVIDMLQKNTYLDLKSYLTSSSESTSIVKDSARLFGSRETKEQTPSFHSLSKCSSKKKPPAKQRVVPLSKQFSQSSSPLFSQFKFCCDKDNNSQNNSCQSSQAPSVSTVVPLSDDQPLVRSCSSEMRLIEETNVNELASYLDDLLHIPRKMSSMAEMMYA